MTAAAHALRQSVAALWKLGQRRGLKGRRNKKARNQRCGKTGLGGHPQSWHSGSMKKAAERRLPDFKTYTGFR